MKRIVVLATVALIAVVILAASGLSVGNAQEQTADQVEEICAPWSKAWDGSEGYWYYSWYRWCYDPATSDPSFEENWYIEGRLGVVGTGELLPRVGHLHGVPREHEDGLGRALAPFM